MTSCSSQNKLKPLVFYDGGCDLCSKEVDHYKRLNAKSGIGWIDISREQSLLNALGVSFDQAMRELHVIDRNGEFRTGIYAFLALWSELPYYRHVATVVHVLRLAPLLEWAYQRFAKWRYVRRTSQTCRITTGN